MSLIKVAVIGAGAAGLCAARYLTAKPDVFEPVVYEQTGRIGGTWVYVEETDKDKNGLPVHSSMYENLKTNLPKEVMPFRDFSFRDSLPSFVGHADVLQYLEDYANHFDLLPHIKFNTFVESVTPVKEGDDKEKWIVRVKKLEEESQPSESNVYDAVIVCNGHYSVPYTPKIPGLEDFQGTFIHSHHYRRPDDFKDKIVVMIGAGPSGRDIGIDVARLAKRVFLCNWYAPLTTRLPDNMEEVPTVSAIKRDNVVEFTDGREEKVDAIIASTGYEFSFPFLSPECQLTIQNRHIKQLYLHLIHMVFPTISFVGMTTRVCPFPQFALQIQLVLAVLEGSVALPSREQMEAEENQRLEKLLQSGQDEKYYHFLGSDQWAYNEHLAKLGGSESLPAFVEDLYDHVAYERTNFLMDYKNSEFRLTQNWWEEIKTTVNRRHPCST